MVPRGRGWGSADPPVMDKRAGERGQFQSRVDGMVGGGRSTCVIMKEDNGLVSLQAASSRGGGNRTNKKGLSVLC